MSSSFNPSLISSYYDNNVRLNNFKFQIIIVKFNKGEQIKTYIYLTLDLSQAEDIFYADFIPKSPDYLSH